MIEQITVRVTRLYILAANFTAVVVEFSSQIANHTLFYSYNCNFIYY